MEQIGNLTTNIVLEIGKKLVAKGIMTNEEMQEILANALDNTYQGQQKEKTVEVVCNQNYFGKVKTKIILSIGMIFMMRNCYDTARR